MGEQQSMKPAQVRLLALDLDGTLLNSRHEITDLSRKAILRAREQGVRVVLCTGRPRCGAALFARALDLDARDALILLNGALALSGTGERLLFAHAMPEGALGDLYEVALQRGYRMHFFAGEGMYTLDAEPGEETRYEAALMSCRLGMVCRADITGMRDLLKVSFFAPPETWDREEDWLRKQFPQHHIVCSKPSYIEISHPEARKGRALARLAEMWRIPLETVMACGDEKNDEDMLRAAGISVAMGNANPSIKAVADFVTENNDRDGVGLAVQKLIL